MNIETYFDEHELINLFLSNIVTLQNVNCVEHVKNEILFFMAKRYNTRYYCAANVLLFGTKIMTL